MEDIKRLEEQMKALHASTMFAVEDLAKAVDNMLWYQKMQDYATVGEVTLIGSPPGNTKAQSDQDKGNPIKFKAYTFTPLGVKPGGRYPLLVYVHGGVHSNFASGSANIITELVRQGYIVISPDYRGSTGYGSQFWQMIDYGGLEVEDVYAARNWAVENMKLVDPERVGIIGWSHGGLISLFNTFFHPKDYQVAYAGVPVSDLVARMGYKGPHYQELFSADYHIGKTAAQDPWEYRRRSPAWHAEKLQTPLLIHTTTNDEDVNVLEVEHLIKSLQAAGKEFEWRIYENAPGGHVFNRIDTRAARESRLEIYHFLARHLSPPNVLLD